MTRETTVWINVREVTNRPATTTAASGTQGRARRRAGFTIIELILVLSIISIVAAIAIPRFASSLDCERADAAARRIAADWNFARRDARTHSASRTMTFNAATDTYELVGVADLDRSSSTYLVNLRNDPYQCDIVSADFGGDADVVFSGYGDPDTGGSVVISVNGETRTITLGGLSVKQISDGGALE